jgi:hypothetical protein
MSATSAQAKVRAGAQESRGGAPVEAARLGAVTSRNVRAIRIAASAAPAARPATAILSEATASAAGSSSRSAARIAATESQR